MTESPKTDPMTDWIKHDPKTSSLVLVGPMLHKGWRVPERLKAQPQVAVDGGLHYAATPVLWAGDGDSGSVPDDIPAFFKNDQNITDFTFCLKGISPWEWSELHAYGFSGGRRDHDLANLGEAHALMKARKNFLSVTFYDEADKPLLRMLNSGKHVIEANGVFSLLCLEPAIVTISGDCLYKVEGLLLEPLSGRGVSNKGEGWVTIETDAPCVFVAVGAVVETVL